MNTIDCTADRTENYGLSIGF